MEILRNRVSEQDVASALNWVLQNSDSPHSALEPEFDIFDDERRFAKKIRKLYFYDVLFWERWMKSSGLSALVSERFRRPKLIKHAAFIKRHADESFIPLHQDLALWEKPYLSAQTFWVALTSSNRENGGMFYVPNVTVLYPHELDIRYPMFKSIESSKFQRAGNQILNLELIPGDIAVWPAVTPHGSHCNRVGQLRVGTPFVFVEEEEFISLNGEGKIL